jgi:hypothetical protein
MRRFQSAPQPSATLFAVLVIVVAIANSARAVDHQVEVLNEPAPAADLSPQIAGELSPTGVRVVRGGSTTLCDIWLRKELTVSANFKPTTEILYPFQPGQFIGVARFARKSSDFRDQDIQPGVYTIRYAQQPVDGAHVGTSPTRDFLLLSQSTKDLSPKLVDYKPLTKQSAEAAGSSHPALLAMQKVATEATKFPAIRHNAEKDWWIVAFQGPVIAGGDGPKPLVFELVVVGIASE